MISLANRRSLSVTGSVAISRGYGRCLRHHQPERDVGKDSQAADEGKHNEYGSEKDRINVQEFSETTANPGDLPLIR